MLPSFTLEGEKIVNNLCPLNNFLQEIRKRKIPPPRRSQAIYVRNVAQGAVIKRRSQTQKTQTAEIKETFTSHEGFKRVAPTVYPQAALFEVGATYPLYVLLRHPKETQDIVIP